MYQGRRSLARARVEKLIGVGEAGVVELGGNGIQASDQVPQASEPGGSVGRRP